ncbi:MAG: hypothetical protein GF375_02125 [Candidatus Omnitrophica bacterium]|nr:hypothetical protein [Candidatus Omnitrophota bacterium]
MITGMSFAQDSEIEERFGGKDKLRYKVSFNGIPSGYIQWNYLGQKKVNGKEAAILKVTSDAKILGFLDITSEEVVYLATESFLPLKVERDLSVFGKEETITEIYNQDEGYIKIVKVSDGQKNVNKIEQASPIHNVLALIYFFPEGIDLKDEEWKVFNLPTRKLRIKMVEERVLNTPRGKEDTYFLLGRGGKRFSLWLDKETLLPLRLEYVFLLGKVIIIYQGPQSQGS